MNNRLEQFVSDHREEFDSEMPDNKIWERIQLEFDPPKKKSAPIFRITRTWMSAAAAVIVVAAGSIWFMAHRGSTHDADKLALQKPAAVPATTDSSKDPAQTAQARPQTQPRSVPDSNSTPAPKDQLAYNPQKTEKTTDAAATQESAMDEEMYHYTRLVELKHKELKAIEKDEPMLYKQFASDVNKLDSVYHGLQHELPKNPNREQLLEAMLQNLQLQMQLLNHQLEIIKQVNHSKKTAYEKAYKTV